MKALKLRGTQVKAILTGCLFAAWALPLAAQEQNEVGRLREQLKQLQEHFDKVLSEHKREIDQLRKQIDALEKVPRETPRPSGAGEESRRTASTTDASAASAPAGEGSNRPWSFADPVPLWRRGANFLDLSLDGLFAAGGSTASEVETLQLGGHDPNQRGFTLQNLEATFTGAVDPYLRGQANVIFQIDGAGESKLEVEEAFLETVSLPANLQIKAGQFFSEFGRLNPVHPHSWDFVDLPLVNARFLGPDGLRNPGGRLAWLLPTPFYSEFFLAVQNSQGETAHSFRNDHEGEPFAGRMASDAGRVRSAGDLLFVPRYAASFDLTPAQTLLLGASAALGPNASGRDADTQIYGVDLFWKWKPTNHSGGFPFVSWQTEGMLRRYQAGAFSEDLNGNGLLDADEPDLNEDGTPTLLQRETLSDYGFYSQLAYGFKKGWVAGLRGDYVAGTRGNYEKIIGLDLERGRRWRFSPNLTWYPSEFSKVRLQSNHDDRKQIGTDHSVWLQFEFLMGSHAAHKF